MTFLCYAVAVETLHLQCRNRYAVLQRGANTVLETPADNSGPQNAAVAELSNYTSAGSSMLSFPCTTPSSLPTEHNRPSEFVFLEPVVSSNPEIHQYHEPRPSQHKTRFKTTVIGDVLPSNTTTMPPSKKRKTRPRTARSNKSPMETRREESTSLDLSG